MNWMNWLAPGLMIATAFFGLRIRQATGRPPARGFRSALIVLMLATVLEVAWGVAWNWEMSDVSRFNARWYTEYSTLPLTLKITGTLQILFLAFGNLFFVTWVIRECGESSAGAPVKTPEMKPDAARGDSR